MRERQQENTSSRRRTASRKPASRKGGLLKEDFHLLKKEPAGTPWPGEDGMHFNNVTGVV